MVAGSVLSTVGILPFQRTADGQSRTTFWFRRVIQQEIMGRLDAMGVVGIVDTTTLCSWADAPHDVEPSQDIPMHLPSQVAFRENHIYYVV